MKNTGCVLLFTVLLTCLISLACSRSSMGIFQKKTPWEQYKIMLDESDLDKTRAGRAWTLEGTRILKEAPVVEVPFRVKGFFLEKDISALAWRFEGKKGGTIKFILKWNPVDSSRLFVDVFQMSPQSEHVTSFDPGKEEVLFEVEESGTYLIRLQPELMGEGNFEIAAQGSPTYSVFPVIGKGSGSVQSFWGASRGGGTRRHEGIDIFAARGTPVVAPVGGTVTSVRNRGLGGKQVWLRDAQRGFSLYFAHLDSQAVSFGAVVKPGDTLGFVGNTGNAKFTPPHLHFGIYHGGAFDPYPVVSDRHSPPAEVVLEVSQAVLKTPAAKANFRQGPGTEYPVLTTLETNDVVYVQAATADWYQVKTPDDIRGFVHHSLLGIPSPATIGDTLAWVKVDPFNHGTDSLQLPLTNFKKLGSYRNYAVLGDNAGNIYYRKLNLR